MLVFQEIPSDTTSDEMEMDKEEDVDQNGKVPPNGTLAWIYTYTNTHNMCVSHAHADAIVADVVCGNGGNQKVPPSPVPSSFMFTPAKSSSKKEGLPFKSSTFLVSPSSNKNAKHKSHMNSHEVRLMTNS